MLALTAADVSSLGDTALLDVLRDKEILRRQTYADELLLITEINARGIPTAQGYGGVGALVREMFRLNPGDARRMVAHAAACSPTVSPTGARIEAELPVVANALKDGVIGPEHVEVIRKAVDALPDDATLEDRVGAEKILCQAAESAEPYLVARLGEEIQRRLDPDGKKPDDNGLADPTCRLDLREKRGGGISGSFELDTETGALLTNLLSPLTQPRANDNGPDKRSLAARRGDAFATILTNAATCPDTATEAGEPVTLMVSVTLDDLKTGIGQGVLDGYWTLSAAQIRRMACDAKVLPVVLGSQGEPLDIGRATRVIPRGIRRALIHRDRGCTFPTCDKKAKWAQAHHITPWMSGGPTALDNLTLLCRHHHRTIHHTPWEIRMVQGHPWYTPPSYVDPDRTPLRNLLHTMRT